MIKTMITGLLLVTASAANVQALEYDCPVSQKTYRGAPMTPEEVTKEKASVKIVEYENGNKAVFSRCSAIAPSSLVTCDTYEVEYIIDYNPNAYMHIKKYYHFSSQFDMQIDLMTGNSFVENNGRGSIAFGKCSIAG